MKKLAVLALWILILGGLAVGYEAVSGHDLLRALAPNKHILRLLQGAVGVSALLVLGGKLGR